MKKFILTIIAIVNCCINLFAILFVLNCLYKSELFHLESFSDMANPSSGWYLEHWGTKLFAFNSMFLLVVEIVASVICTILTLLYLRIKRTILEKGEIYDSFNVKFTKTNVSVLFSIAIIAILSIYMYQIIPMSIPFVIMTLLAYKFIPVEKILYKIGLGWNVEE